MADARRSSTRHAVSLIGECDVGDSTRACTVVNLSLGGALVALGLKLPMGRRIKLAFVVPTMAEAIETGATVRWSDDAATGVQFDGLRAREVWALNKFFEQLEG